VHTVPSTAPTLPLPRPVELELELGPLGYLRTGPGALPSRYRPSFANLGIGSELEGRGRGARTLPCLDAGACGAACDLRGHGPSLKAVLREGSLQRHAGPSIGFEAGVLLPTWHGDKGWGPEGALIVSQRWMSGRFTSTSLALGRRTGSGRWGSRA